MARRIRRCYRPRPLLRWLKPVWACPSSSTQERLAMVINGSHPFAMPLALRTGASDIGGMRLLAKHSGLNRESLYRALAPDGNPTLHTLDRVLAVFGLRLTVAPISGTTALQPGGWRRRVPTARDVAPKSRCARGGNRTHKALRPEDFKSPAST